MGADHRSRGEGGDERIEGERSNENRSAQVSQPLHLHDVLTGLIGSPVAHFANRAILLPMEVQVREDRTDWALGDPQNPLESLCSE